MGLHRFYSRATLALGSVVVSKHQVFQSAWRTSSSTVHNHRKLINQESTLSMMKQWWCLDSKTNIEILENKTSTSWALVSPTKERASAANQRKLSHLMRSWYFSSSVNSFFKRAYAATQWGQRSDFWSDPSSTSILDVSLCVQTARALARLRACAGSPEPSLVAYVVSTIISCGGSYYFVVKSDSSESQRA